MVEQFLRKTANFTESPANTMSQPAVITLYPNCIFLPDKMVFTLEYSNKTIPVISGNTSAGYS
jgi:hypothetical protein